ncbi:MAG: RNA 2',3'-cyclic phosphodiesterase [Chloroflexota bacterium]|nr:RNA 2',3'-cyclic phosphodiesterase [Chloroflexota bacterium]
MRETVTADALRGWRTFVAISLPEDVQQEVVQRLAALRSDEPSTRWVAAPNLHLTLLFLGDTEPAAVPEIVEQLRAVAAAQPPFAIELAGAGTFGRPRHPGTLWLGLARGAAEAEALSAALADRLGQAGDDSGRRSGEGRWRPHLTLARRAPAALRERVDRALGGRPAIGWWVQELSFYRSHLGNEAPIYAELAKVPLGG